MFYLFVFRNGKGVQFIKWGSSTFYNSGTIAHCVRKYQCEKWDQTALSFRKHDEQTAVKSKDCMRKQSEIWTTERTSIIQIAITRQV